MPVSCVLPFSVVPAIYSRACWFSTLTSHAVRLPHLKRLSRQTSSISESSSKNNSVLHGKGTLITVPKFNDQDTLKPQVVLREVGKLKKVDVCRENGIQPRDLRALDTGIRDHPASILVRKSSILFSVPELRAVIRHDRLLLLEPPPDPELPLEGQFIGVPLTKDDKEPHGVISRKVADDISMIIYRDRMGRSPQQSEDELVDVHALPFEFVCLEALLALSIAHLSKISQKLDADLGCMLSRLSEQDAISTKALQELQDLKSRSANFHRQATTVRKCIDSVLQEPQDMAAMYLTDQVNGKPHELGDDDIIELLLETYGHQCASLCSSASLNIDRLEATDSHIALLLSATRNRLLHLEIRVALATLAFAVSGFITGSFGMNLHIGLEQVELLFWPMMAFAAVLGMSSFSIGRRALLKAKRVKTPILPKTPPQHVEHSTK